VADDDSKAAVAAEADWQLMLLIGSSPHTTGMMPTSGFKPPAPHTSPLSSTAAESPTPFAGVATISERDDFMPYKPQQQWQLNPWLSVDAYASCMVCYE